MALNQEEIIDKWDHLPQYSHNHVGGDTNSYLQMSSANYGTHGSKFSVALRWQLDVTTGNRYFISKGLGTSFNGGWWVRINSNGRIRAQCNVGFCTGMLCSSVTLWGATTTTVNDTDPHEALINFDTQADTAANRLKIWLDGSLETFAASALTNGGAITTNTRPVRIGTDNAGTATIDGKIYNICTTTSGNLLAVTDIRETDGTAKDLKDLTVLKAHPDTDAGSVVSDFAHGTNWSNINSLGLLEGASNILDITI